MREVAFCYICQEPVAEDHPVEHATPLLVARALELLGAAYRGDWSDFDGRSLRHELDQLGKYLREGSFDMDQWLAEVEICAAGTGCWAEWCSTRSPGVHSRSCDHLEAVYRRLEQRREEQRARDASAGATPRPQVEEAGSALAQD